MKQGRHRRTGGRRGGGPSLNWRRAPYVSRVCAGCGSATALGLRVGRACPRSAGVPADSGLRAQSGTCPGPRPAHRIRARRASCRAWVHFAAVSGELPVVPGALPTVPGAALCADALPPNPESSGFLKGHLAAGGREFAELWGVAGRCCRFKLGAVADGGGVADPGQVGELERVAAAGVGFAEQPVGAQVGGGDAGRRCTARWSAGSGRRGRGRRRWFRRTGCGRWCSGPTTAAPLFAAVAADPGAGSCPPFAPFAPVTEVDRALLAAAGAGDQAGAREPVAGGAQPGGQVPARWVRSYRRQ
jgi:hypothetical protein